MSPVAFNRAAKHLFRHLHEPHALRLNPLVRHLFESHGKVHWLSERDSLNQIHTLVRQGAAHCRDVDLMAGKDERAHRQYAIIALQCLERTPIQAVAVKLGISYRHCYRERAEICRRVARYVYEYCSAPISDFFPELDEFRLLMDRAMHHAAFSGVEEAFSKCDGLIRAAPSTREKIEALRISAMVSIGFGNVERAEAAYHRAQALHHENFATDSSADSAVAQACNDLVGAALASDRANTALALVLAQRATQRLKQIQGPPGPHVRELYVEGLYQLGSAFCDSGNLEKGYDCLAGAEANLCNVRAASTRLRARIMVAVWKLRNHLLMDSSIWCSSSRRLQGLAMAFEQAYASASFVEAAYALDALTECHAFAGNDTEALHAARRTVLLIEQQPSERLRLQMLIRLATTLLSTQHWKYALSLLPSAQQANYCDAYHRELAFHFYAKYALRVRAFNDAWTLASGSQEQEYANIAVGTQIVGAAAAHALERRHDARTLVDATISAAETLRSAPTLRDAYHVAARVTGDRRFERQASEIAKVLTA